MCILSSIVKSNKVITNTMSLLAAWWTRSMGQITMKPDFLQQKTKQQHIKDKQLLPISGFSVFVGFGVEPSKFGIFGVGVGTGGNDIEI